MMLKSMLLAEMQSVACVCMNSGTGCTTDLSSLSAHRHLAHYATNTQIRDVITLTAAV